MSYLCPVCNGLTTLHATCTNCYHELDDFGRLDQVWEPYAPYREIDDLKMSNGFNDFKNHQCIHVASCPICGVEQLVAVYEKHTQY